MDDLLSSNMQESSQSRPLAARMRPQTIADYIGQAHLLSPGKSLYEAAHQGRLHSMILWGPPGVGKTTLARLLAPKNKFHFIDLSAVMSGIKDIRQAAEEAKQVKHQSAKQSVLFVDEVHRFNKAQQDAFLPFIEEGTFVFIGATTENPAFELNNALLSRARVHILKTLPMVDLNVLCERAISDKEKGLGKLALTLDEKAKKGLLSICNGDARQLLNMLEIASDLAIEGHIGITQITAVAGTNLGLFDKGGDVFYDQISAFHKSVRGSDPNAALYWLARILAAGCDPLYIARRILAIASEDIGNADPRALTIAVNAWQTFERLGPEEGNRAIAHAAVYCACAAKSNAVHVAFTAAQKLVQEYPDYEVPKHLRNAPTQLAKQLGHGAEYRYAHDEPLGFAAGECYLPKEIANHVFYQPTNRGLENQIEQKLVKLQQLNKQSHNKRYQ